jgi:hypothetical protein
VNARKPKARKLCADGEGPTWENLLKTAPALPVYSPAPPEPPDGDWYPLESAEHKEQMAWEMQLAARVRAGEISVEAALSAVSLHAASRARATWIRSSRRYDREAAEHAEKLGVLKGRAGF